MSTLKRHDAGKGRVRSGDEDTIRLGWWGHCRVGSTAAPTQQRQDGEREKTVQPLLETHDVSLPFVR